MLYSHEFGPRAHPIYNYIEKGTRRLMRTNDRLWKLFANTGSIYAYLWYRQVNQAQASS
jgi:hypothetical protein